MLLDEEFNPIPFTIHRRSDRLLEVYTKAHRRVYSDRSSLELTGRNGGAIDQKVTVEYVMPKDMTAADYEPRDD